MTLRADLIAWTLAACSVLAAAPPADAGLIDFESLPRGTVLDDEFVASHGVKFSAWNLGGGPHELVIFDTMYDPTGCDPDLTYSWAGGNLDRDSLIAPLSDDVPLGKIFVIAENSLDANGDGLTDEPDDEAGGGIIRIDFGRDIAAFRLAEVDLDENPVDYFLEFYRDGAVTGSLSFADLALIEPSVEFGDRHANQLPWLTGELVGGTFDEVRIHTTGSGGFDRVEWQGAAIPEPSTTVLLAMGGIVLLWRKIR